MQNTNHNDLSPRNLQNIFKISVVITSFNQKDYLLEAIESALNQTLPAHEILIADDASTDNSQALIRSYSERHPALIHPILNRTNQFIPANRNSALLQATGTHVLILDGDDRLLPGNLEAQSIAILKHDPSACSYTNLYTIDTRGKRLAVRDSVPRPTGRVFDKIVRHEFGLLRSMLMPLDAVRAAGLMNEKFPTYDGYVLTLALARLCPFVYVSEPQAEYRVYPESDSNTTPATRRFALLRSLRDYVATVILDLPEPDQQEIMASWTALIARFEQT